MLSTSAIISTPEDEMEETQLSTVNVAAAAAAAADTTTNVNMSNKLHGHTDTDDMLHLNSSRNDGEWNILFVLHITLFHSCSF